MCVFQRHRFGSPLGFVMATAKLVLWAFNAMTFILGLLFWNVGLFSQPLLTNFNARIPVFFTLPRIRFQLCTDLSLLKTPFSSYCYRRNLHPVLLEKLFVNSAVDGYL